MHRQAVHLRLANYISRIELGSAVELDDGYYRFLIQLKVDSKADMVHIKRTHFDRYLANAADIKQIEHEEQIEILAQIVQPPAPKDDIFKIILPSRQRIIEILHIAMWASIATLILRGMIYG